LNAAFDIAGALNSPVRTLSVEAVAEKAAEYRRLMAQAETAFRSARAAIGGESAALDKAMDRFGTSLRDVGDGGQLSPVAASASIRAFERLRHVVDLESDRRAARDHLPARRV
jgi:hypothetical protein